MPEKEGKEVPVNNELMIDRIDFAVDDSEASLVRNIDVVNVVLVSYSDQFRQPSQMDIPLFHGSTRQEVFDNLSQLDDNIQQGDFEILLSSPDLFDMSDDHLNKSKDPEIDTDLMASLHDHNLSHVHNHSVTSDAALPSTVNISAESQLKTEQIKSFLDLPEAEFGALRRKSPAISMYNMDDESMELITQQSSVYYSSLVKSVRPSAVCHLWSSSPHLLTNNHISCRLYHLYITKRTDIAILL